MPKAKIIEFLALAALCGGLPSWAVAQGALPSGPATAPSQASAPRPPSSGPAPSASASGTSVTAPAQLTQSSMGQMIEQVKRSRLGELAPAVSASPVAPMPDPGSSLAPAVAAPPALWSLSGVNDALVAEVLIDDVIHRFRVARGRTLPGGWTVLAGDVSSVTLQQGRKVLTLFPVDQGSVGAEFPALRRQIDESSPMNVLQSSLNKRGIPVQFIDSMPASKPAAGVEQARSAAASLPRKP